MLKYLLVVFTFLISATQLSAQVGYEVSSDPKHPEVKVLKGTIDKYLLQKDSSFAKWYTESQRIYTPDSSVIRAFKNASKLQYVLFGGTWCDDTQFVVPKFFKLLELSAVPDSTISFFGVDRNKQALGHIAEAFAITNVPTIIIMKDGKEIGRVVEYGKTGQWDKELAAIINTL